MIVSLSIDNFLRIKAVQIKPDGSLVQITGRNNAGKSSILNAIQAVLGGRGAEPDEPIRRGADVARVAVVIDDKYLVEKVWDNGQSKLKVTSPDGKKKYASPQTLLNELYADIGFDPLAFTRAKPSAQAETLRKLAGLDFTEIDASFQAVYDDRTDVNRQIKTLVAQLKDMPEVEAPDREIDLAALAKDLADGQADHERYRQNDAMLKLTKANIARLEAELLEVTRQSGALQLKLVTPPASDLERLEAAIGEAEQTNRLVRQRQARRAKDIELGEAERESESYTDTLDTLRADRRLMIEAAEMPLDGLGFDDDGLITYNGIPFSQASQSEQLRISTAIGMKLNPGGVILIRDGSLLDTEHLAMLEEMTAKAGACVWLERVTDGEQVGIVIEDGAVVEPVAAA